MKKLIFLFLVALFFISANQVQTASVGHCRLDENNACKDYSTALSCKTLNYCKAEIWKRRPVETTQSCSMCMEEIKSLQMYIKADSTKKIVEYGLIGICGQLDAANDKETCKMMIKKNFHHIYQDLYENLDTSTVCRALRICNSNSVHEVFSDLDVEQVVADSFAMPGPVLMKSECEEPCQDVTTAKKCGVISTCTTIMWSGPVKDDELCDLCKQEVSKLQDWLKKGSTKAEIEHDMKDFCNAIPLSAVSQECIKLVNEDFDMIYDMIADKLKPSGVCSAIKLCQPTFIETNLKGMMEQLPGILQKALDAKRIPKTAPLSSLNEVEEDSCSDCEAFVKDIQMTALNNKKVVGDWMKMLNSECDVLGEGIGALDPKTVCQKIMMCDAVHQKRVGDMCTDCKTFFTEWQNMLKENPSMAEAYTWQTMPPVQLPSKLKDKLDEMIESECASLGDGLKEMDEIVHELSEFYCLQKPETERAQCVQYVAMVIKIMLKRMENEDAAKICSRIEFCDEKPIINIQDLKKFTRKVAKIITTVLPKHEPQVGSDYCTDCHNFIEDLQDVIKNKPLIVNELVSLVKQECDQLGELSEVCVILVSDHYQDLLKQFSNTDVRTVCTTIMMCGQQVERVGGDLCSDCKTFFGDWQEIIMKNGSIVNRLNALISQQCDSLGPAFSKLDHVKAIAKTTLCAQVPFFLKGECESVFDRISAELVTDINSTCSTLVKEELPQVWNLISYTDTGVICDTLYFCDDESSVETEIKSEIVKVTENDCTDCDNFIGDLQVAINSNSTIVRELVALVKQECYQLGELSEVCEELVNEHGDIILQMFNKLDVGTICSTIMMCGQQHNHKDVTGDICTDCSAFFKDWQNIIANKPSVITQLNTLITQQCDNLGPAFSKLDQILVSTKKTVCDLVSAPTKLKCQEVFDQVTSKLITVLQQACSTFAQEYLPQLWDLISYTDTGTICSTLYFCSNKSPLQIENMNPKTELNADLECEECKFAIETIEKQIEGDKSEEAIASALADICHLYGEDIRDECETFMKQHSAQIIDFLIAEMNAQHICQEIGLCEKSLRNRFKTPKKIKSDVECEFCELLLTEVDKLLSNTATQEEILNEIGKVCQDLGKEEDECNTIVHEYGPEVLELIAQELKPSAICAAIKLCTSKSLVKTTASDLECEVCTLISQELDKLLEEDATEEAIENALDEVCSILPSDFKETCDGLVKQFGPQIVQILVEEFNTSKICTQLGLCNKVDVQKIKFPFECVLCKEVMTYVDSMIDYKSTEKDIHDALMKACELLKSTECKNFVDRYGDRIVKLIIEEGTSPMVVCFSLGACSFANNKKSSDVIISPVTSEISCELCKLVAEGLDSLLTKDSTQEEIEAALEKVCSILPSSYKQECDDLVTQYGPEIVQLLVEEMNPSKICVSIKLCPETIKEISPVSSEIDCELCKLVAEGLESLLTKDSTQEEIEAALEKVCSILPSQYKQECDALVKQYGPEIVQLLVEEMNPSKICVSIKLCPETFKENDEICDVCKVIAQELDHLLSEKSTQEEIENALKNVCSYLNDKYKITCDNLIETYFQDIMDGLIKTLEPLNICPELRLCPKPTEQKKVNSDTTCAVCKLVTQQLDKMLTQKSTQAEIKAALNEVCELLPSKYTKDCESLIGLAGDEIVKLIVNEMKPENICPDLKLCPKNEAAVKVSAELTCELCEAVATGLDDLLKEDSTKEEIEAAVEEVCHILPENLKNECETLITEYGDTIVQLLVEQLTPAKICPEIGLCPKKIIKTKVSAELTCELCEAVAIGLDDLLKEDATKEEIEAAVEEVCHILPENLKSECETLITEYGDTIVELLVEQLAPAKICPELGLCPKRITKTKMGGVVKCHICKLVMGELEKMINKQSTDEEILNAVNKVCDVVPEKSRSTCHEYIKDYGPGVIAILINDFVPGKVCKSLKVCQTSSFKDAPLKLHLRSSDSCVICKDIIHELDVILKNNVTKSAIIIALDSLCDKVPAALSSECKSLVMEYTPIILKYADKILDPSFMCLKMKLCPTDLQKPLIGADPCTYGPSFWCRDLDTAKRCNAVEHCMNHIWDEK